MPKITDKKLLDRDAKRDIGAELLQAASDLRTGSNGRKTTIEKFPDGSVMRMVETGGDPYSFDAYNWFRYCQNSNDSLLKSLLRQLDSAWRALVFQDEVDPLNREVDNVLNQFISSGQYSPLDEVKMEILQNSSDHFRQTVKWASVYAGLAGMATRQGNISDARQFISISLLLLLGVYRPARDEAYNNHVSRKGGAAHKAKRQKLRDELILLIKHEIRSHRKPFNSKLDAARYFSGPLNEAAKRLGIPNIEASMVRTMQTWFSKDETLKGWIKNIISPNRQRKINSSR